MKSIIKCHIKFCNNIRYIFKNSDEEKLNNVPTHCIMPINRWKRHNDVVSKNGEREQLRILTFFKIDALILQDSREMKTHTQHHQSKIYNYP